MTRRAPPSRGLGTPPLLRTPPRPPRLCPLARWGLRRRPSCAVSVAASRSSASMSSPPSPSGRRPTADTTLSAAAQVSHAAHSQPCDRPPSRSRRSSSPIFATVRDAQARCSQAPHLEQRTDQPRTPTCDPHRPQGQRGPGFGWTSPDRRMRRADTPGLNAGRPSGKKNRSSLTVDPNPGNALRRRGVGGSGAEAIGEGCRATPRTVHHEKVASLDGAPNLSSNTSSERKATKSSCSRLDRPGGT